MQITINNSLITKKKKGNIFHIQQDTLMIWPYDLCSSKTSAHWAAVMNEQRTDTLHQQHLLDLSGVTSLFLEVMLWKKLFRVLHDTGIYRNSSPVQTTKFTQTKQLHLKIFMTKTLHTY